MVSIDPTEPTWTCLACGRTLVVKPDGRGDPVAIARRKLERTCRDAPAGHESQTTYRAGVMIERD